MNAQTDEKEKYRSINGEHSMHLFFSVVSLKNIYNSSLRHFKIKKKGNTAL